MRRQARSCWNGTRSGSRQGPGKDVAIDLDPEHCGSEDSACFDGRARCVRSSAAGRDTRGCRPIIWFDHGARDIRRMRNRWPNTRPVMRWSEPTVYFEMVRRHDVETTGEPLRSDPRCGSKAPAAQWRRAEHGASHSMNAAHVGPITIPVSRSISRPGAGLRKRAEAHRCAGGPRVASGGPFGLTSGSRREDA